MLTHCQRATRGRPTPSHPGIMGTANRGLSGAWILPPTSFPGLLRRDSNRSTRIRGNAPPLLRKGTTFGVLQYLGNPRYLSSTRRYFRTRVKMDSWQVFRTATDRTAANSGEQSRRQIRRALGKPAHNSFHDRLAE